MKLRRSALVGVLLSLTFAGVSGAQQSAFPTTSSADADAEWVWSPDCGCMKSNKFSKLVVTPLKLSFVSKGKPETRSVYLENTGNLALDILAVEMGPQNVPLPAFSMPGAPIGIVTIQPKKRIGVQVDFLPATTGGFTADISILSDASKGNQGATVSLLGKATKPAVTPTQTPISTATPTPTPSPTPTATPTPTPISTPSGQPTSTAHISLLTPGSAIVNGAAFSLDVKGSGFEPSASVYWNGAPLPTAFVSDGELTAMIPASAIASTGTQFVGVASPGFSIGQPYTFLVGATGGSNYAELEIDQPAADLIYDANRQVIYLSVPSTAATNPNTISVLNLASGRITSSPFAGSSPDVLAMSDDNQFLYVGLDGQASVERFSLPALTPDMSIPLGRNSFYGPYFALDIQVAPGAPHTIAVSLANMEVGPEAQGGVVIYDDSTARMTTAPGGLHLYDSLQWAPDASNLYAANTETSSYDFYTLLVNAMGVTLAQDYSGALSARIHFDPGTGLLYDDDGHVIDPTTGNPAGQFPQSGAIVPDSSIGAAFFVNNNGFPAPVVQAYNLTQFSLTESIQPSDLTFARNVRVIRWGQNGIAFNNGGTLYLIGGNFVH